MEDSKTLFFSSKFRWAREKTSTKLIVLASALKKARQPCHKGLVAGQSLRRPGSSARPAHAGFVVDKVAMKQGFLNSNHSTNTLCSFVHLLPSLNNIKFDGVLK